MKNILNYLFPYKLYKLKKNETIENFSQKHNLNLNILKNNNIFNNKLKKIIIPNSLNFDNNKLKFLKIKDIINYKIEEWMQNSENPTFFIYYCTSKGDFLGKLILFENEMVFQPLNQNFKGFLNQEKDDFFNNSKLFTYITYNEILNNPCVIKLPNLNFNNIKISNFLIQIEVSHTGYYPFTCKDTKNLIENLKKNNKPLANLYFKIKPFNLFGDILNDEKKCIIGQKIINILNLKKMNLNKNIIYNTNIPYFDINYNLILEYITKKNLNQIKEEEKIYYIQKNLIVLEKIYGYKMKYKNLLNINNHSYISIENVFPKIKILNYNFNQASSNKINESNNNDNLMLGKINSSKLENQINILNNESQIINNNHAIIINNFLPPFLKGTKWNLYYSKNINGTSFNTLKRTSFNKGELMIILKDEYNNIFGGFTSESLNFNFNYYGTRETFLFTIKNENISIHNCTLENDYFLFTDEDGFGFGSGNNFGLFIDKSLNKGSSYSCKTFNNPCLAKNNTFSIKKLEIWGFKNETSKLF